VVRSKKIWLITAGAVFVVISLLAIRLMPASEPVYKNRTLTDWLNDYYVDTVINQKRVYSTNTDAYFAIRAIGTNALPTLLHWIALGQSQRAPLWVKIYNKIPDRIAVSGFVRRWHDSHHYPCYMDQAFLILGTDANGAVPELTRMMRDPLAKDDGYCAAIALAYIEPAGFAPLAAAARDPQARCRQMAIRALSRMVVNKSATVRLMEQLSHDPDPKVSATAKSILLTVPVESQSGNP
jgi:hypothetical protein